MAQDFPPAPKGTELSSTQWRDWLDKVRKKLATVGIAFVDLDFTGSNLTSITTRNHNDLTSKQGGTTGEFYHLSQAQHTDLTDAGDSALHFHSTDRARANHTGTQALVTISDVTMTASNLNTLDDGVTTSLHFHNADRDRANHTGTQDAATITGLADVATSGDYVDLVNTPIIKHQRVTTGSISAGSTALVTVTWSVAFADANYTAQASVLDATSTSLSLSVVHIETVSATQIQVRVLNNAIGPLTGTLHVLAIHD